MASSLSPGEQMKTEWRDHEQVPDELLIQASRFLQIAGSFELARHALEMAAEENYDIPPGTAIPVSLARHEDFARQCGYATYAEMTHFAAPVGDADDKDWYLTPIQGGHWVIWNDCDCVVERTCASYEEATQIFQAYRS